MNKILLIILALIIVAIGGYLISPAFKVVELYENLPIFEDRLNNSQNLSVGEETPAAFISSSGKFNPGAHEVKGEALLLDDGGRRILVFSNFETINGPDLHVYLSSDLEGKDYVDLGELKATKGSFNYKIDKSVDLKKHNKVLVWCVPFKVLFSYAELNESQENL